MLAVGFMCFEIESFIRGDEIFVRRSTAEVCRVNAELGAEKRERDNPRAVRLFWRGSTYFQLHDRGQRV